MKTLAGKDGAFAENNTGKGNVQPGCRSSVSSLAKTPKRRNKKCLRIFRDYIILYIMLFSFIQKCSFQLILEFLLLISSLHAKLGY